MQTARHPFLIGVLVTAQPPLNIPLSPVTGSPAAEPSTDGAATVCFASPPEGKKRGNWIQTLSGRGFFRMLHRYSLLEPFFSQAWRPSEIELVK